MVILTDTNDNPLGSMGKMEAHRRGLLHRAFSVLLFDSAGRMLIQRRAAGKYHSGGLWSNACCSHPDPGQAIVSSAQRRLAEEMGIRAQLHHYGSFIYRANLDNGMIENEYDHILLGSSDVLPVPGKDEVSDYKYMEADLLACHMQSQPECYTQWFRIICRDHLEGIMKFIANGL